MHIILGLLIAFVIVAYFARRNKGMRGCRWRQDTARDKGALHFYRCAACGAEAYTATKGPPRDCKAKVASRPL